MWSQIWSLFLKYSGNGLAIGLFAAAFVYLFVTEKDKGKRFVLLYASLVSILLFFCPLFAAIVYRFMDEEIYYRILWLIPMSVIIAYAGTMFVYRRKRQLSRIVAGILCVALVIGTGDYVYDNPYFSVAQNRFHVPQTVADVCDGIIIEGREVRAVFPSEMLNYVRQYTANVMMPYGREIMVESWTNLNPLFDALEARVIDCELVAELAAEQSCHFIIIQEMRKLSGSFENTDYYLYKTIDGFDIYVWKYSDFLPENQ